MATAKNREPDVGGKGGKQRGKTSPPVFSAAVPHPETADDLAEDLHSRYSRHVAKLDRFLAEVASPRRSWTPRRSWKRDAATDKKN